MLSRWTWVLAFGAVAASSGAAFLIACSSVPETNFGNPATLQSKNLPGEGGSEQLVCTGFDAGGGGGGGGGDGGGGNCGVSWAKDIFPLTTATGAWKCADAKCHGGVQAPVMNVTTPQAAYDSLKDWQIPGVPHPYINADGGGDPSKSTLQCNLLSQCGQGMPRAPGRNPTKDEHCLVDAWLRCGAPNN